MILIACTTCRKALRVSGDLGEMEPLVGQGSEYWPDKYPCFHCEGTAAGFLAPEISAAAMASLAITDVTVQEAFAALNGLGVPEERTCCAEVVEPLFEKQGIKVHGRQPRGTTRYLVAELEFPDGSRMFFGTSPQGALIYRITKKHSYLKAVETADAG